MTPQTRRHLLMAAAALTVSGLGLAVKHRSSSAPTPEADPALADFWSREFDSLGGSKLVARSFKGRPLVLNFWATWCPPCVKEMPELDRFALEMTPKGWQVLGVAIDQIEAVRRFLQTSPVSFPIAMAGLEGLGLVQALGNTSGGLPFTLVLGADGQVLQRKTGATHYDELIDLAHRL